MESKQFFNEDGTSYWVYELVGVRKIPSSIAFDKAVQEIMKDEVEMISWYKCGICGKLIKQGEVRYGFVAICLPCLKKLKGESNAAIINSKPSNN